MKAKQYNPDWDNCDRWQEFEWEQALKHGDHLASRYFRMLERFGDLPDAEELIANSLGEPAFPLFEDSVYAEDWVDEAEALIDDEFDASPNAPKAENQTAPGDPLYYETFPMFQRSRQIALGWCNILASVLKPEDRFWGVTILFYLGRLLSYLSLSIEDGTLERLNASVSFGKRALQQVNMILGELDRKIQSNRRYATLFKIVREHLMEVLELLTDHLMECKKQQRNDSGTADSVV